MSKTKNTLLILSGRICTGKSTLAQLFNVRNNYDLIMTKEILKKLTPSTFLSTFETEREGLINYSIQLDTDQNGEWIASNISNTSSNMVIDSIRLVSQLQALKNKFKIDKNILHVYLKATDEILIKRFSERNENKRTDEECSKNDFIKAKEHIIELKSEELEALADIVISTDAVSIDEIYNQISNRIAS